MKSSVMLAALLLLPGSVLLAPPNPPDPFTLTGENGGEGDFFGWSVAPAGDVNGDGVPDLIVGAPTHDGVAGFAGEAYLFYGPTTSDRNYDLPNEGRARLTIYDVLGRRVRTLVDGQKPAGTNVAVWDGRDDLGHLSPSGIYFCRLEADGLIVARRVVLLR